MLENFFASWIYDPSHHPNQKYIVSFFFFFLVVVTEEQISNTNRL